MTSYQIDYGDTISTCIRFLDKANAARVKASYMFFSNMNLCYLVLSHLADTSDTFTNFILNKMKAYEPSSLQFM